jgi:hypothetical protein
LREERFEQTSTKRKGQAFKQNTLTIDAAAPELSSKEAKFGSIA